MFTAHLPRQNFAAFFVALKLFLLGQFLRKFSGTTVDKSPYRGVSTAITNQKCLRAFGKHNDVRLITKSHQHLTSFEVSVVIQNCPIFQNSPDARSRCFQASALAIMAKGWPSTKHGICSSMCVLFLPRRKNQGHPLPPSLAQRCSKLTRTNCT